MDSQSGAVASITKILTDFALTKFPVEALEVKGPIKEGTNYRWRIASTRFKEVVVVLKTKKPLFRGSSYRPLRSLAPHRTGSCSPTWRT